MRVHDLARELGMPIGDLMAQLRASGVEVSNRLSTLDEATVEAMRAAAKAAPPKPKPPPPPPKPIVRRPLPLPRPRPVAKPVAPPKPPEPPPAEPPVAKPPEPAPKPLPEPLPAPPPPPPAKAPAAPVPAPAAPATPPAVTDDVVPSATPPTAAGSSRVLVLKSSVVVKDLAEELGLRPSQIIRELMAMNIMASINERLDLKVAQRVAEKHGFTIEREKKAVDHSEARKQAAPDEAEDRAEDLAPRPPIVTFLGHVDHGKTSLLDCIRQSSVAKGEAGGITQHIGAYTIASGGKPITFLDTPGHEAFTAMRARGARLTDIAVVVIAADDGIMPQTKEAIQHAQAAKVPIMVAINKIDLPAANSTRVKQQLMAEGLSPEEWGGTVICCDVSATTGQGVDHLLEMILLQAEVLELRANPKRRARGYVIEARMEPGMGPTANLLVLNGTLRVGSVILCSQYCGRIKALINDHGVKIKAAGPSTPVQCLGLPGVPEAGAEFVICLNEREARVIAEQRQAESRANQMVQPKRISLETLYQQIQESGRAELNMILKADVQGSLEAIEHALREIHSEKVDLHILVSGVGNITLNDVQLATASNAVIFGFHVALEPAVSQAARQKGIEIRLQSIIYELIDEVRNAMVGLLPPETREKVQGHAEVKQVFSISKGGTVAGCLVTDGLVTLKGRIRVKRGADTLFEGVPVSLRRFQNDVSEVHESQECGIRLDNFTAFQPGDILEVYQVEKIAQTL